MRSFSSALTFFLVHSIRIVFVTGHWETGLDGDLYGEAPRPTNEPLLYRGFNHGAVLMETNLGHQRNVTARRNLVLGARQGSCKPGYVLTCPITDELPCCPEDRPLCCSEPSSTCCTAGYTCVGLLTCCSSSQIGCTNPEGCCPAQTTCCGIYCCIQGYECRNGNCVNEIEISLSAYSVASVAVEHSRSLAAESSRSLESVRSKSSELAAATETTYGNGDGKSNNVALVGGVVGGVLGAAALGLLGFLFWRRKGGSPAPPSPAQQSFFGQQPSSQPITPASPTFSTNTSYLGGLPVTYTPQPVWHPQQSTVLAPQGGAGSPIGGQTSAASQQSASPPPGRPGSAPAVHNFNPPVIV